MPEMLMQDSHLSAVDQIQGRISVMTTSYPVSHSNAGALFIRELCQYAASRSAFPVSVYFPGTDNRDLFMDEDLNIRLHPVDYFPIRAAQKLAHGSGIPDNLRRNPALAFMIPFLTVSILKAAREAAAQCDLIHAHWAFPAGWAAIQAKRNHPQLKVVITIHSSDLWLMKSLPMGPARLAHIISQADHVTVISRSLAGEVEKLMQVHNSYPDPSRTSIVPMGIHASRYAPDLFAGEKGRGVLYLGRLVPIKGVRHLIHAVESIPDAELDIVGDGWEKQALIKQAAGIERIRFCGNLTGNDKLRKIREAAIAVFPSIDEGWRREGIPVSLLECMASGAAVIVTESGSMSEVIRHGENGLIVPSSDSKSIEDAIRMLLQNPGLRRKLGKQAMESSQKYDWTVIGKSFEDIYRNLMNHE